MHPQTVEAVPLEKNVVTRRQKVIGWLKKNLLLILTVLAVLLAVAIGLPLRYVELDKQTVMFISFPGEIMMNMLKMIVLPLLITSIVTNIAKMDGKQLGKMGAIAITYYLATTVMAVVTGIIYVMVIHPGQPGNNGTVVTGLTVVYKNTSTLDTMFDLLRNMFPENIATATSWQMHTVNGKPEYARGMNVIGIIVVSIVSGIVLANMPKEKKPVVRLLASLETLTMNLVMIIMWYTPIGILFLVLGKVLEVQSFLGTMAGLGLYMLTVLAGLLTHSLITLPLIYFACTRKNPLVFAKGMLQAILTALATASSSATLPLSMKCLEDMGIDVRVIRFVMPVGATINMDGTALYEAVATIFIAQLYADFELTIGKVIVVSLTATLASIGAAAVPSAGIITMMIVLSAIGLPQDAVAIILAVDWLLDRFRTAVNVWGDAIGAGIVQQFVGRKLPPLKVRIVKTARTHETSKEEEEEGKESGKEKTERDSESDEDQ